MAKSPKVHVNGQPYSEGVGFAHGLRLELSGLRLSPETQVKYAKYIRVFALSLAKVKLMKVVMQND